MKNALFISGGGTKIAFLGAVCSTIIKDHNVQFDNIVGVSAGAILSIPLAMNMHEEIKEMTLSQTSKNIFRFNPNSVMGKASALLNIILGKPNIYDDSNLEKTIKSVITPDIFRKYKYLKRTPNCYVIIVNIETGEELMVNLKDKSYEDAISYIIASASIPVYVKPRKIKGNYYYDGGLRSHIGSVKFLQNHVSRVKNCISVFSRPEDLSTYRWTLPTKKLFSFNQAKVLSRVIDIMNIEISKSDEYIADTICEARGIHHLKIFAQVRLATNPYEISERLNNYMWETGVNQANKIVYDRFTNTAPNNGIFNIDNNS